VKMFHYICINKKANEYYLKQQKQNNMTTLYNNHGFKITFNNSATFFITDSNNDCWGTYSTERKAKNAMKKILSCRNIEM